MASTCFKFVVLLQIFCVKCRLNTKECMVPSLSEAFVLIQIGSAATQKKTLENANNFTEERFWFEKEQAMIDFESSLQDAYSRKLYGGPGRVPKDDALRLIWLDLLEPWQQEMVGKIGVCKWSPMMSIGSPYFAPFSYGANPVDSLWKHSKSSLRPGKSHEWMEITHCPKSATEIDTEGNVRGEEDWFNMLWFYAAAGSGLSVNLGSTVFLEGVYEDRLQAEFLFGLLDEYDSIQLLHREGYSSEIRLEIVFRGREDEKLTLSAQRQGRQPQASIKEIKCGRHPHLFDCQPDLPQLRYVSRCQLNYSQKVSVNIHLHDCTG